MKINSQLQKDYISLTVCNGKLFYGKALCTVCKPLVGRSILEMKRQNPFLLLISPVQVDPSANRRL